MKPVLLIALIVGSIPYTSALADSGPVLSCKYEVTLTTYKKNMLNKEKVSKEEAFEICDKNLAVTPLDQVDSSNLTTCEMRDLMFGDNTEVWKSSYTCIEGTKVITVCSSHKLNGTYALIQQATRTDEGNYKVAIALRSQSIDSSDRQFDKNSELTQFVAKPKIQSTAAARMYNGDLLLGETWRASGPARPDLTIYKEKNIRKAISSLSYRCHLK